MALIRCPECGKEVSDQAKTCAHCGFPIAKSLRPKIQKPKIVISKKKVKTILLIVFVLAVGIIGIKFLLYILGPEYKIKQYIKYYNSNDDEKLKQLFYNGPGGNITYHNTSESSGYTIISYDYYDSFEVPDELLEKINERYPEEKGTYKSDITYKISYLDKFGDEKQGYIVVAKFGFKYKIIVELTSYLFQ